jgi:hypothetical protein
MTGSRAVASLAPGVTSSGTVSVTVTAGTAAGTYFLLACSDDNLRRCVAPLSGSRFLICGLRHSRVSLRIRGASLCIIKGRKMETPLRKA